MENEIAVGIRVLDNVFDKCQEVIEYADNHKDWIESRLGDQRVEEKRTSKTLFLPMMSWTNPDVIHEMNKTVWTHVNQYAIDWNFVFYKIEDPSIQKYEIGQKYDLHFDHGGQWTRICSAVLYLNDVEDGGETHFPYFDVSVTPKAGRLAIFPANYTYAHAALPPKSGVKYAVAYWAEG